MKLKKLEDQLSKAEAIKLYTLSDTNEILNIAKSMIKSDLHEQLLNFNMLNQFTFNLNFHTEEEMLNQYNTTFSDLNINKRMPQLYKIAYEVFINRDARTFHNKECFRLVELENGNITVKDTSKTVKRIIDADALNNTRSQRIPKNYYFVNSDQRKELKTITCSAGNLELYRENKTQAGIKNIYVVSIEIDLHDIDDVELIQQKKEEIKDLFKTYDLPGTVCYTTNRSVYMQYVLSHPISINDYKMLKKILAHRIYKHFGLAADLANTNPAIIQHVKLTLHDKNNMQSIVAPFLWYDIPYDTGALLNYCKYYINNYGDEFNEYFKSSPTKKELNNKYQQLKQNTYKFLLADTEIYDNFNLHALTTIIKNINTDYVNVETGEVVSYHGFDNLFNTLNKQVDNINLSYNQQINNINIINNFLTSNNINAVYNIIELHDTVQKIKTGNLIDDKQLKQIINNTYDISNAKIYQIASWLRNQQDLMEQCTKYYNTSLVIIKYCKWLNNIINTLYKNIETNKIISEQQNNENDYEQIQVNDNTGIIPFDWQEAKTVIKTKYINYALIENSVLDDTDVEAGSLNLDDVNRNNDARYEKMIYEYEDNNGNVISNILSEDVIPSYNFKCVFKAAQKFKNSTLTENDINEIRRIFGISNILVRNMSYASAKRAILRELGNKLHMMCDMDTDVMCNKKGIKHQFYSENRASMMFNTSVECKFAQCTIETFYSFNGKPSGSILDLITWCFANKTIEYVTAKYYAIKFLAKILNINIIITQSIKSLNVPGTLINNINELVTRLIILLNKSRKHANNSADIIKLVNLIINKLAENVHYTSNVKVLKKYKSLDKEIIFNTQAMLTTNFLQEKFGWSKTKSSRLMNLLFNAGIFKQITNKDDIADKRLQASLIKAHNIPFIVTFLDFNQQLKCLLNNNVITQFTLSKLKIEFIFNLERATKIKYNNWTASIKDKFNKLNFRFTPITNNTESYPFYNSCIKSAKNFSSKNINNNINIDTDTNTSNNTDSNIIDDNGLIAIQLTDRPIQVE